MPKMLRLPVTNGSTVFINPQRIAYFKAAGPDTELIVEGRSEALWIKLSPDALAAQCNEALKN